MEVTLFIYPLPAGLLLQAMGRIRTDANPIGFPWAVYFCNGHAPPQNNPGLAGPRDTRKRDQPRRHRLQRLVLARPLPAEFTQRRFIRV